MTISTSVVGAIDIGGTKIAIGLEDEAGRIFARTEIPTNAERDFENAMKRVITLLSSGLRETKTELKGIGIGCTGPVDPLTGVLGNVNFFPHWEGCNLAGTFSQAFGVSTVVENDADAAALAEATRGAAVGKHTVICVTVGTGIGAGILLGGHIYRGKGGVHPEIGHHVIQAEGPLCSCGARGCWEAQASGPAIADWLKRETPKDAIPPDITTEAICSKAREGDPSCQRAVDRGAQYLGIGVANLINMYCPEVIVLSGGVMKSADLFLEKVRSVVREQCRLVPFEHTQVVASALGGDSGLIGAAESWRYRTQAHNGAA